MPTIITGVTNFKKIDTKLKENCNTDMFFNLEVSVIQLTVMKVILFHLYYYARIDVCVNENPGTCKATTGH